MLNVQASYELKVISLGSASSVKAGESVVAIGAPLGLSGTVTSGIVSALDRTVEVPGENDRAALLVSALQTDASINPGNSGGALVPIPPAAAAQAGLPKGLFVQAVTAGGSAAQGHSATTTVTLAAQP